MIACCYFGCPQIQKRHRTDEIWFFRLHSIRVTCTLSTGYTSHARSVAATTVKIVCTVEYKMYRTIFRLFYFLIPLACLNNLNLSIKWFTTRYLIDFEVRRTTPTCEIFLENKKKRKRLKNQFKKLIDQGTCFRPS